MKLIATLGLLALVSIANAGGIVQGGAPSGNLTGSTITPASITASTITINGDTNSACLSIGSTFTVNCQNGRVGIGTTAPASKLHMSSGTLTIDGTGAKAVIGDGPTAGNVTQMQFNGSVGTGDRKSIVWNQPGVGTEAQMDMKYFSPDTAFVWGHLYNGGVQTSDLMILRGGGSPTTLDVLGSAQFGTTAKSTIPATGGIQFPNNTSAQWLDASGNLRTLLTYDSSNRMQVGSSLFDTDVNGGSVSTMRLTGGNVGVGTTAPASKLHMSSGTLTIDGNVSPSIDAVDSVGIGIFTTAQLQAKTPKKLGQLVYNSSANEVCVSTGTSAAGSWEIVGNTLLQACQ